MAEAHPGQHRSLTSREQDVLRLIAGGLDSGEIAAKLVLSTETVRSHAKHVLAKLNARNRAHAVHRAWEQGFREWEPRGLPSSVSRPPVRSSRLSEEELRAKHGRERLGDDVRADYPRGGGHFPHARRGRGGRNRG